MHMTLKFILYSFHDDFTTSCFMVDGMSPHSSRFTFPFLFGVLRPHIHSLIPSERIHESPFTWFQHVCDAYERKGCPRSSHLWSPCLCCFPQAASSFTCCAILESSPRIPKGIPCDLSRFAFLSIGRSMRVETEVGSGLTCRVERSGEKNLI